MNPRRIALCLLLLAVRAVCAQPSPQATAAFDRYTAAVEQRLAQQRTAPQPFAPETLSPDREARLLRGARIIEPVAEPSTSSSAFPSSGAMLHHWRGTAFLPHAHAADFEAMLHNVAAYPQHFAPEVLRASLGPPHGKALEVTLRVRQKHILTVVLDTTYDVTFGHLGPNAGDETSRSTDVQEIAGAGTSKEHPLAPADAHGFLWRQNTYWTWAEHDGGLLIQVESVSLSRAIPAGLGWAVRPFVESVPRESLEFTLRSASLALRQ